MSNNRGQTVDNSEDNQAWRPSSNPAATMPRPVKPLTRKQKLFVKHIVDNPKASATAAAKAVYNIKDHAGSTARTIAAENLAKPSILAELAKYDNTAQSVIIEVMEYSKELGRSGTAAGAAYAANARQSADSLLDRIHGKATQRTEVTSRAVTLNIDLTATVDNPVDNSL